jgi:hypothetical protein
MSVYWANITKKPLAKIKNFVRPYGVDVCVVGSGPFNLVRAIQELKKGQSVLILERQAFLGGAWAAQPCFGDGTLHDVVAHLMAPFPKAYELLINAGFEMRPRPVFFWDVSFTDEKRVALGRLADGDFHSISSPKGHIMAWHQYYALEKAAISFEEARREANMQRQYFNQFMYLDRSFQPIIDRLVGEFRRLGGKFNLNYDVDKIHIDRKGVFLRSPHSRVIAKKLISGRHLDCDFCIDNVKFSEEPITNDYNSLLIHVNCLSQPKMMYVNVVNHCRIGAFQVAPYGYGRELEFVYCIIGSFDFKVLPEIAAEEIVQELNEAGLAKEVVEIRSAAYHRYSSQSHSSRYLSKVQGASTLVEINIVNSISQCIAERSHDWAEALRTDVYA